MLNLLASGSPVIENFPTISRVYTGFFEWAACFIYIIWMRNKKLDWKTWLAGFGFLIVQIGWQIANNFFPWYLWIFGMVFALGIMFLFTKLLSKSSYNESAFVAIRGFVMAEFLASFVYQIYYNLYYYFPVLDKWYFEMLIILPLAAIVFVVEYLFLIRIQYKKIPIGLKDAFISFVIGIVIFSISNLNFLTDSGQELTFNYINSIFQIRTVVTFSGVIILYAHMKEKIWTQDKLEKDILKNLVSKQYNQYKSSKDSIDVVNMKYHDLKHQINVIRNEKDASKKESYLDEMQEDLEKNFLTVDTGNPVLDIVINTKKMVCKKHGITLNYVIDGKLLSFLSTMDICSLFGNALDNAIEAVLKIDDKEKRLIKINVFQKGEHIVSKISNTFLEGELKYKNEKLLTTKNDLDFHGFGIQSIKATTRKYEGHTRINIQDSWFNLIIVFPIDQKNKSEE